MLRKIRHLIVDFDCDVMMHVDDIRYAKKAIRRYRNLIKEYETKYDLGILSEYPESEISDFRECIDYMKINIIESKDKLKDALRDFVCLKTN